MKTKACRDCGYQLDITARGCPRCAMNVEAEAMIERFIWRRFVPSVVAIVSLAAVVLFWWWR